MRAAGLRRRRLPLVAAIVFGVFALIVSSVAATWIWRAGLSDGSIALARLARHGTSSVDDFKHFPARELAPSRTPAPFAERISRAEPPVVAIDRGRTALSRFLASSDTLALLVIRDGAIVFEHYAAGHDAATPSQYFSVTKSILATLLGMAIDDGHVRSLDQPVTDFVPELSERGFGAVTLRQLADMTSDLDYVENDNPFGLHPLAYYTPDVQRLVLQFRRRSEIGRGFEYKSGDTALLSLALQRALGGETLTAYAQRRLWSPLGMEHSAVWSLDRDGGFEKAWCCIAGTARDLAKLGRLYLARGRHGGQQLLSERWIESASAQPAAGVPRAYIFGWWPASARGTDFMAAGKDGQFLYIAPAHDAIVVRLGRSTDLGRSQWVRVFDTLAAHAW